MRTFTVVREQDESGVSGVGTVAEGTIYSDGSCTVRWMAPESPAHSTSFFNSISEFVMIHVAPHEGNHTKIIFDDGSAYEHTTKVPAEEVTPVDPPKQKRSRKRTLAPEK